MKSKQVTLDKLEYDAMETELTNLKKIVESRTVAIIAEPYLNFKWPRTYHSESNAMKISFVLGTDSGTDVKDLTDQINHYVNKLQYEEDKVRSLNREVEQMTADINRLNQMKWYDKLIGKK